MARKTFANFYATCCNTCKNYDTKCLKVCSGCRIVCYCSYEHQKQDWPDHKDICKCIGKILKNNNWKSLFNSPLKSLTWSTVCSTNMLLVELELCRMLTAYERQILMFPNICAYCKMYSGQSDTGCMSCFSVKFCSEEHKLLYNASHLLFCDELKLCFFLDINTSKSEYPKLHIMNQKEYVKLPSNIHEFICSYTNLNKNNSSSTLKQKLHLAYFSEVLTCPLTFLFVCENEKICLENVIVHIVGPSSFECFTVFAWECVLHWIPLVKSLHLVFIGPECIPNDDVKLCSLCEGQNKTILIEYYPSVYYHDYTNQETYVSPNIILAFNCGFHENTNHYDTWSESIPLLLQLKHVPLVLTSYTEEEAKADLLRVKELLNNKIVVPINCNKNVYSSKRPHRDWESDPLKTFCANSYISVIKVK